MNNLEWKHGILITAEIIRNGEKSNNVYNMLNDYFIDVLKTLPRYNKDLSRNDESGELVYYGHLVSPYLAKQSKENLE